MVGIITLNTNLSDPDNQVPLVVNYETAFAALNSNLLGWGEVRASAVTVDGSNNTSQLNDLSGNGAHFTQAVTSRQPLYATNVLNGRSALYSDGSLKAMTWGGAVPTAADFTKVVLARATGGSGTVRSIFSTNTAERNMLFWGISDTVTSLVGDATPSQLTHSENVQDEWVLIVQSWDESTGTNSISINGSAAETEVTVGAGTDQSTIHLFANTDTGISDMIGYIAMAQVWNIDLLDAANSTELDLVKAYVRDTYGLNIS